MEKTKLWNQLYGLPKAKKEYHYDRPKRSKANMIEFAASLGLEINFNCYGNKRHGVKKDGVSIVNDYGVQDSCQNLLEIEECLEDYKQSNNL